MDRFQPCRCSTCSFRIHRLTDAVSYIYVADALLHPRSLEHGLSRQSAVRKATYLIGQLRFVIAVRSRQDQHVPGAPSRASLSRIHGLTPPPLGVYALMSGRPNVSGETPQKAFPISETEPTNTRICMSIWRAMITEICERLYASILVLRLTKRLVRFDAQHGTVGRQRALRAEVVRQEDELAEIGIRAPFDEVVTVSAPLVGTGFQDGVPPGVRGCAARGCTEWVAAASRSGRADGPYSTLRSSSTDGSSRSLWSDQPCSSDCSSWALRSNSSRCSSWSSQPDRPGRSRSTNWSSRSSSSICTGRSDRSHGASIACWSVRADGSNWPGRSCRSYGSIRWERNAPSL